MIKMSTSVSSSEDWRIKLFGRHLVKCSSVIGDSEFELISTDEALDKSGVNGDHQEPQNEDEEIYGVYFSFANINVECDDFTKSLAEFYKKFNEEVAKGGRRIRFEVIQVVLWTHTDVIVDYEATFRRNILDLPWYAVPFSDVETKVCFNFHMKLAIQYKIGYITKPTP